MKHPNHKMTGLPGRKALKEEIGQWLSQQERFAVAVMDVDSFANLNHDLWHVAGDKMLVQLAELLSQAGTGKVYRTGGGEFTLVIPQVSRAEALLTVEKLRAMVASTNFALADGRNVTVTVGVAHSPYQATEAQGLLDAAAAALLDGKREMYLRREAQQASERFP